SSSHRVHSPTGIGLAPSPNRFGSASPQRWPRLSCSTFNSVHRGSAPMTFFSTWKRVLKNAAIGWSNDRCSTLGAAISYYTLFSLAPLLLISIGIIGIIFGTEEARAGVLAQIGETVGD